MMSSSSDSDEELPESDPGLEASETGWVCESVFLTTGEELGVLIQLRPPRRQTSSTQSSNSFPAMRILHSCSVPSTEVSTLDPMPLVLGKYPDLVESG